MSTPISELQSGGGGGEDTSQMVDGILDQFEQDNRPQQGGGQMQQPQQQQSQQYEGDQFQEDFEEYYDQTMEEEMSTTDQIISEGKLPLLVVLLVFLSNYGLLNDMIIKNIPRLGGDGGLNMLGMGAKALIAGVIFYLVRRFLL